ncbi:uncharacterized protein BO97DRAFT_420157 [Aspergillus homomorphus CBS 101889]|uniref:Uncharacterized protein n=1 Tax=Aspergillus homomorphus (strain CBS 101889) TaxID=1450537 RepID=A0A395IC92_ASPHC|nr:hypothetical protein BO97DRAFT_420157 [Aspergillus homomorphus CBS 101889]RAL16763.1 hypothetical protein BO97DRAFT_420157 [Aspergillus homomorphus CBS 101889]
MEAPRMQATTPEPPPPFTLIPQHTKLLVHPLFWTSSHLNLVRCQFKDLGVAPAPPPPDEDAQPLTRDAINPSDIINNVRCTPRDSTPGQMMAMKAVLQSGGGPFQKHECKVPAFFSATELYIDCFEDYRSIVGDREKQIPRVHHPKWGLNLVGVPLWHKRRAQSRSLTSSQPKMYLPRLLLTESWDHEFNHICKARISGEVLDMLDNSNMTTSLSE